MENLQALCIYAPVRRGHKSPGGSRPSSPPICVMASRATLALPRVFANCPCLFSDILRGREGRAIEPQVQRERGRERARALSCHFPSVRLGERVLPTSSYLNIDERVSLTNNRRGTVQRKGKVRSYRNHPGLDPIGTRRQNKNTSEE